MVEAKKINTQVTPDEMKLLEQVREFESYPFRVVEAHYENGCCVRVVTQVSKKP